MMKKVMLFLAVVAAYACGPSTENDGERSTTEYGIEQFGFAEQQISCSDDGSGNGVAVAVLPVDAVVWHAVSCLPQNQAGEPTSPEYACDSLTLPTGRYYTDRLEYSIACSLTNADSGALVVMRWFSMGEKGLMYDLVNDS